MELKQRPARILVGNVVLDRLPAEDLNLLLPLTRRTGVLGGQMLAEAGVTVDQVFFPIDAVVSLIATLSDGSGVEVASVGREGVAGAHVLAGFPLLSNVRMVCYVPGECLAMDARVFDEEVARASELRALVTRSLMGLLAQSVQGVVCNRLHSVEERLIRWLLLAQRRTGQRDFAITQELLSNILGVRRASVTVAAGFLQRAGYIRLRRGGISILDPAGLRRAACECAATLERELSSLDLGPGGESS
jgi:CRP-like cAMP-binding protein